MNTIIWAQLFEYSNNPNIHGNTVKKHNLLLGTFKEIKHITLMQRNNDSGMVKIIISKETPERSKAQNPGPVVSAKKC